MWNAAIIKHKGEQRISVSFEKNAALIEEIKQIEGRRWSQSRRLWHLPDTDENRIRFGLPTKAEVSLSVEGQEQINKFKHFLKSKRYSDNTIKTYVDALKSFFVFYAQRPVVELTNLDVIHFNNAYILKNNLSASYQNQVVNAIKLYYKTCEDTKMELDKIHRPKRSKDLPNVLSKEEVKSILEAHYNIKHRVMLSLIYSCGLHRSELLNLKTEHIDSNRNIVLLRHAKGKKDRIVPLSPKILVLLREYYKA
jgi:integrase/recombinase XerD